MLSKAVHAIDMINKPEDADDIFGKMIASELKLIRNDGAKRRLKFQIQKLIFESPNECNTYNSQNRSNMLIRAANNVLYNM